MSELMYLLAMVALLYWVGLFWYRVGRWFYLHWRETRRRVVKLKDAAMAAYREEP
jgi:hypothetical protein